MNKTNFPSILIIILAWQAHANLSIISGSMNICEGQIKDNMPPIKILTDALARTTSDMYRSDSETTKQYTKDYCHNIAKTRAKLFTEESAKADS
jgi:hypothetical protein